MIRFFLRRFHCLGVARIALVLFAVFAFFATATAPTLAAGGQFGNVTGTVVDSAGHGIAGAHISLAAPSGRYEATTGANGTFSILGVTVDTYTVSIQVPGYEPQTLSGVTVIGDQNLFIGNVKLQKQLRTIARTTSRSISSAYQPNQTVDTITISGARALQTTGKAASNDEQALILSAPGTSVTNTGAISIRGGLLTEVGYQFDGIPYTEPFFTTNGAAQGQGGGTSGGFFNGLGSLQVVEGAGDATQGNIGGGVVNLIPKRGTYPGTGLLDAEIGGPNFNHQFDIEYGIASRDGRTLTTSLTTVSASRRTSATRTPT